MKKLLLIIALLILALIVIVGIRFFINIKYYMCTAAYENQQKAVEECSYLKK